MKKKKIKIISTLAKSIREYKLHSILTPIFIAIESLMECLIPIVVSKFIDTLETLKDVTSSTVLIKTIGIYGAILVAMAFISLFGGFMAAKFGATASAGFAKNLRHDVFYKIQDFSFENIDKFSTSSLVTRLTTDVNNVHMTFGLLIRLAVRSPMMLIFSTCLAFTYHKTLPLIFLAVIPIIVVGFLLIFRKVNPIFNVIFKKYDNLNNTVQENVRGIRVVKAYVREDYEIEKFTKASKEIQKKFTLADKLVGLNNPLMSFSIYICMTVIAILGAKIIITSGNTSLTVGSLTALTTYTMQILSSLMMLSFVFIMFVISAESARRIVEVLQEEPTITNPEPQYEDVLATTDDLNNPEVETYELDDGLVYKKEQVLPLMEVANGDIDFNGVCFKYSQAAEKYALKNIDLHIKSGETIGVLGGTGSSKSSLIQLISRLYDTTSGDVLVAGRNVKDYDLDVLRNQVSVVLQKNVLFSGTIAENLRWGNKEATDSELVEACKLAQAHDFIESFPDKYNTHIDQGGTNVSGGQRQRLCIARALLKKPRILILDDSTSAVDTKTDALIRKGFKEFIPTTTKIIIAQRVSSVEDADKIIILDNGEINAIGTHKDLLKNNAIYQEVYYSQNKEIKKEGADVNE